MSLPTLRVALRFAIQKIWQLLIVVIGGGIMLLALNIAMSPSQPNTAGNWIWIDAPKIPILWKRGWWLECTNEKTIHCTLVSGDDHTLIYSGDYVPCDSKSYRAPPRLRPPSQSSDMWIVTQSDHRLAPIVFLDDDPPLVPAGSEDKCKELLMRRKR